MFAADLFGIKDVIQFFGFIATIGAAIWYLARTIGKYEVKIERLEERVQQLITRTESMEKTMLDVSLSVHRLDMRLTIMEDRYSPRIFEKRETQ